MIRYLLVLTASCVSVGTATAADSEFIQQRCEKVAAENGDQFLLKFVAQRASRTLSFEQGEAGSVVFKGTTVSDMKWVGGNRNMKELIFSMPKSDAVAGQLTLIHKHSGAKVLGWITPHCWSALSEFLAGSIPTRRRDEA